MTGRDYKDLTPPEFWPIRRYRLEQMVSRPCAGVMIYLERHTAGRKMAYEVVTLPLAADRPGGPRFLISNVTPTKDEFEPPAADRPQIVAPAERFRFLEIGAGTPSRTRP